MDDSGDWLRHAQGLRLLRTPWCAWFRRERYSGWSPQALSASEQLVRVSLTPVFESRFLLVLDIAPASVSAGDVQGLKSLRWWVLPDSLDDTAQRALRRRFRFLAANRL
jgi:hypothetical protein